MSSPGGSVYNAARITFSEAFAGGSHHH